MEINSSFTLRNVPDKDGMYIVYLLLSKSGQPKKQINIDVKVDKALWKNQRVLPKHENAHDINLLLGEIESRINKIKINYRLSGKLLTVQKLYEQFQQNTPDFDFISFCKAQLKLQDFAANTIKAHTSIIKKLEEFRGVLPFYEIDEAFINQYKNYLRKKFDNNETTVYSNLKTIKKYMHLAEDNNIRFGIEAKKVKIERFAKKTTYLKPHEVAEIKKYFLNRYCQEDHKLPIAYFLTACYTGMRISDIQEMKNELLKNSISFDQVKTGNWQFMKLNNEARALLMSYPEFFTKKLSDQKINKYLKEVAKTCNLDVTLTMHVGRHTFASTYIRSGGNLMRLKQLLGHTKVTTTEIYVHLIEDENLDSLDEFISY